MQSDDSEDESPQGKQQSKKQTAQKGRKHMVRIFSPDPPDNAAQPPRNRQQQEGDEFIKGLGETLSTTAAASDRAALERHRETQRSLLYQTELKAYVAEKKQTTGTNGQSATSSAQVQAQGSGSGPMYVPQQPD